MATAALAHIGLEPRVRSRAWDDSPKDMPGRIASAWLNVMGGITLYSVYMRCSERWIERNVQLVRHLASLVQQTEGLWVIGGDFNMAPTELQNHPVFDELKGLAVAPTWGTCSTTGGWKTYDYFVVHPALKYYVHSIEVDTYANTSPHLPVRLKLRAKVPQLTQRVPSVPKPLPFEFQQGCARPPPQWPLLPDSVDSQKDMDHIWSQLIACVET